MNPTARWVFRGVWRFAATVVLTLVVLWIIGLVIRALTGSDTGGDVYP